MRVTVLGSGTGWLRIERRAPAYLVTYGDFHILLDIGPGTLYQLLNTGLSLNDISAIFISHFHPDHVTDLIPFFFATRYQLGYTPQTQVFVIAHKKFQEFHEALKGAFGQWVSPPEHLFRFILLPGDSLQSFDLGPFRVKTLGVNHNEESLAIRLELGEKSLIYSGDTGLCNEIIELARGGDLLILECANSQEYKSPFHLGPEDIAEIALKAKPKRILLSHFYPHSESPPIELIQKVYDGEIILAKDFQIIEI